MEFILQFIQEIGFFFSEIAIYLVFGFFVAGLLHVIFPERMIDRHLGKDNFKSVLKATLFGIPLP
ncbi:permease, partial [bacterium]|nr:permease [bacterium]